MALAPQFQKFPPNQRKTKQKFYLNLFKTMWIKLKCAYNFKKIIHVTVFSVLRKIYIKTFNVWNSTKVKFHPKKLVFSCLKIKPNKHRYFKIKWNVNFEIWKVQCAVFMISTNHFAISKIAVFSAKWNFTWHFSIPSNFFISQNLNFQPNKCVSMGDTLLKYLRASAKLGSPFHNSKLSLARRLNAQCLGKNLITK